MKLDDALHRPSPYPFHGQGRLKAGGVQGEAETEAGRHGAGARSAQVHGHSPGAHEPGEKPEAGDKKDQQHRRDDPFDRARSAVPQGEKEGLKTNPELKNRQNKGESRPIEQTREARKSPQDKNDERFEAQSVPNSVFGQDRVTISPEAQMPTPITRKADAASLKKGRRKSLPPGLNGLAARANPAPKPPAFEEFLGAFVKNFS